MAAAQQMIVSYSAGGVLVATYATWNPADKNTNITLSNGNLTGSFTATSGTWDGMRGTVGKSSGKWYWEITFTSGTNVAPAVANLANTFITSNAPAGSLVSGASYKNNGNASLDGTSQGNFTTYAAGAVLGFALNCDASTLAIYSNNVLLYTFTGLSAATYYAAISSAAATGAVTANFGATAFTYAPPGGYYKGLGNNLPVQPLTYATWNPADKNANITLSNGNLTGTTNASPGNVIARSTISKTSGKWYWECTINQAGAFHGISNSSEVLTNFAGQGTESLGYAYFGGVYNANASIASTTTYAVGDVIGYAVDAGARTLYLYKNNTLQTTINISTYFTGAIFAAWSCSSAPNFSSTMNFGATALTYTPPTGYNAGLYV